MNIVTKVLMGLVTGIVVGGVVGFYGAVINLPLTMTAGIIGPITAAIVAVILIST